MYKADCYRCNGTGRVNWASHVLGGVCFACNGVGIKTYKNKPRRGVKYAFGTRECFPQFWRKFPTDQKAADFASRESKPVFMCENEYNSRFSDISEASDWAATL